VARTLNEHWPILEDIRPAMLVRLGLVVADPMAKLRAVLAAAKTLATLSRINLSLVDTAIRAQAHEELEERVTQLEARLPSTQGRK
jgi:hypothetical protein